MIEQEKFLLNQAYPLQCDNSDKLAIITANTFIPTKFELIFRLSTDVSAVPQVKPNAIPKTTPYLADKFDIPT